MLQPECALPILSWYEDLSDRALYEMIPLLIELSKVNDVRDVIPRFVKQNVIDFNLALNVLSVQHKESRADAIELSSELDDSARESHTNLAKQI